MENSKWYIFIVGRKVWRGAERGDLLVVNLEIRRRDFTLSPCWNKYFFPRWVIEVGSRLRIFSARNFSLATGYEAKAGSWGDEETIDSVDRWFRKIDLLENGNFDGCYPVLCFGCYPGDFPRKYCYGDNSVGMADFSGSRISSFYRLFYFLSTIITARERISISVEIRLLGMKIWRFMLFSIFSSLGENDLCSNYKFWPINLPLTTP